MLKGCIRDYTLFMQSHRPLHDKHPMGLDVGRNGIMIDHSNLNLCCFLRGKSLDWQSWCEDKFFGVGRKPSSGSSQRSGCMGAHEFEGEKVLHKA